MHMVANNETAPIFAEKIFLGELNSVPFWQIRHINAVIDHVIETCAKFLCPISIGISIICWGFSDRPCN